MQGLKPNHSEDEDSKNDSEEPKTDSELNDETQD